MKQGATRKDQSIIKQMAANGATVSEISARTKVAPKFVEIFVKGMKDEIVKLKHQHDNAPSALEEVSAIESVEDADTIEKELDDFDPSEFDPEGAIDPEE